MTDDFTRAVMDCCLSATMKLTETPEDYQTAQDWEATWMPLTVALRGATGQAGPFCGQTLVPAQDAPELGE